jgi:ribose 5-phosphate isomerase B
VNERDTVRWIALGSDHTCYQQKVTLRFFLESNGYRVKDVGCFSTGPADYPDVALAVARAVVSGGCDRGIVMDVTGIGSAMTANKIKGIRAAVCHDLRTILAGREHNNANVLALGGAAAGIDELCVMARTFLETRFDRGRHLARVNKIMRIERGYTEE